MIRLEELFQRAFDKHDPERLHKVEFFILLFITEGKGKHKIDFTEYSYERGTLFTIRKDQIHRFFREEAAKGYLLLFTDEFLVSYLDSLEGQKSLQLFNELLGEPKIQLLAEEFSTISALVQRIEAEYVSVMDEYSPSIIRSELHILISKLFRIKSHRHQVLNGKKYLAEFITFQELVEKRVRNTTRVSDYASEMAVSTKTLNTISKSILGKTAKEFIDEISIKQIKRLLINTSLQVKEIAYLSGFEETSNFYKYFRRQVGMTPEQFRAAF